MDRAASPCPPEGELARLLTGDDVWHDLVLPRHLFTGCPACWGWLGETATRLSTLPFTEPLPMAVIAAATASLDPPPDRLKWMRPLHAADAQKAAEDPLAFCRLVLHETLPAGLRDLQSASLPRSLGPLATAAGSLIESTAVHLQRAAEPWLTVEQRHDLEAIASTYRAITENWATRFDDAEALLKAARCQLQDGSGDAPPWVIWHTAAAPRERLAALTAGADRTPHLHNALAHLAAAAERLPSKGNDLQRAELAHDTAQIHLALDDPPAAVEALDVAWRLVTQQQATGLYLASITRFGQVQAALAMAKAQPLKDSRRDWAQRAEIYLQDVQAFGLIEPEEWGLEAQQIALCLEDCEAEEQRNLTEVTAH